MSQLIGIPGDPRAVAWQIERLHDYAVAGEPAAANFHLIQTRASVWQERFSLSSGDLAAACRNASAALPAKRVHARNTIYVTRLTPIRRFYAIVYYSAGARGRV